MITTVQALTVLAEETVNPDDQQAMISGALPIAGLFVLALGVVIFILWRSMNKQMGKIDKSLPAGGDDREQAMDRALTQEAVARGEEADPSASGETSGPSAPND
jgi:hypothetical protein